MHKTIRYLTHPQVLIKPTQNIQEWSLNTQGRRRVHALASSGALQGTTAVISSAETKAIETAQPLAEALACPLHIREGMHENDRSATGFLPPSDFEETADEFFAHPDQSIRGWETAHAAQARIVAEFENCLAAHGDGDLLFVGHGAVGTLLYCQLSQVTISREFDQGTTGGGCYFAAKTPRLRPTSAWRPMENLFNVG